MIELSVLFEAVLYIDVSRLDSTKGVDSQRTPFLTNTLAFIH